MHINESPAPSRQLPALLSPVIPINQPFSTLTGPPTPVMQEVLRPPTPKISTPQRTCHRETPPITTPTRLRSHITPTKKADVGMLCAQEMHLALLPSTHEPPLLAEPSTNSNRISIQHKGILPTPRIIPPTPLHPADHYNYAESHPSCYLSPGNSRRSPVYVDGRSVYDVMMPLPVDPRDNYSDGHNNCYHQSLVHSHEGSIQLLYQHPVGYTDLHGRLHTHLSPRADYLGLPGPPWHPSYYCERSVHPFEGALSYISPPAVRKAQSLHSQSLPASNYNFPQSHRASPISSQSPLMAHPGLPGLARGEARPSQLPLAGTPQLAGDDKVVSIQAPTSPLVTSKSIPQPSRASKGFPEQSVLPLTGNLTVPESGRGPSSHLSHLCTTIVIVCILCTT